jgi:hypothetical protein
MNSLLDLAITAISLIFLTILLTISGVAIPGLFLAAAAPWLDWIIPVRRKDAATRTPEPTPEGHRPH